MKKRNNQLSNVFVNRKGKLCEFVDGDKTFVIVNIKLIGIFPNSNKISLKNIFWI